MAEIVSFPSRAQPRPVDTFLSNFGDDPLAIAQKAVSGGLDRLEEIVAEIYDTKNLSALQIIAGEAVMKVARRFGRAEAEALAECFIRLGSPSPDGGAA